MLLSASFQALENSPAHICQDIRPGYGLHGIPCWLDALWGRWGVQVRPGTGSTAAAAGPAASGGGATQQVPLAALEAKLDEVLEACGFDRDASMTPLQKLTTLEVGQRFPMCLT